MTTFDSTSVRSVSEAALATVKAALEPLGLNVAFNGQTSWTGSEIRLRLSITTPGAAAATQLTDKSVWERHAKGLGIDPAAFGKQFVLRGSRYEITGLNLGSPKFIIAGVRVSDGKKFKFPASVVSAEFPVKDVV